MENGKLSRREKERQMHRRLILEAALNLFSQRGFHDVSMQEIAEEAEFAIGTLYKFFTNKEDLYETLLRETATAFFSRTLKTLSEEKPPLQLIKDYVRISAEFVAKYQSLLRLYMAEIRGFGSVRKAHNQLGIRDREKACQDKLAEVIARGISEGKIRSVDPTEAAIALGGLLEAFFMAWIENPESNPRGLDADLILDLFFNGVQAS